MTGRELALKLGMSNITYWRDCLIMNGHVKMTETGSLKYKNSAIEFIKGEKEKRKRTGGGLTRRNEISRLLTERNIPFIEIGYTYDGGARSHWYYTSPDEKRIQLGKNYQSVLAYLNTLTRRKYELSLQLDQIEIRKNDEIISIELAASRQAFDLIQAFCKTIDPYEIGDIIEYSEGIDCRLSGKLHCILSNIFPDTNPGYLVECNGIERVIYYNQIINAKPLKG